MIDRVRNTVLTILNKESRGTIPPAEFNRLGSLAQRSIFEDTFYDYNRFVNMQNKRMTNSEYSDIPKNIRERIDLFAETSNLTFANGDFTIDNTDIYRVMQLYFGSKVIEEVPKSVLNQLNEDIYSQPTLTYPVYVRFGDIFKVYPTEIQSNVTCFYIREPKTPKWTYTTIGGNPIYNPSAPDFQDFEIHPSEEPKLIQKILGYCGVVTRSQEVIQAAMQETINIEQSEQ